MGLQHTPVMVAEVLDSLGDIEGRTVLDLTIGPGGHAKALIERGAFVIGLDRDPSALELARENLAAFEGRFSLVHGRMSQVERLVGEMGVRQVAGVVLDAGLSMVQLLDEGRGLSVHSCGPLDMRMDQTEVGTLTAFDVVNSYLDKDLIRVFAVTGRGREARRVAARIVRARQAGPIRTARELADLIAATIATKRQTRRIDAARYLMAIRVEVNDELTELQAGVVAACNLLSPTGRLAALTWQSAEMRTVRDALRRLARPCDCPPALPCICGRQPVIRLVYPRPLTPSSEEVARNPSARSARLHVAEKLAAKETGGKAPGDPRPSGGQ